MCFYTNYQKNSSVRRVQTGADGQGASFFTLNSLWSVCLNMRLLADQCVHVCVCSRALYIYIYSKHKWICSRECIGAFMGAYGMCLACACVRNRGIKNECVCMSVWKQSRSVSTTWSWCVRCQRKVSESSHPPGSLGVKTPIMLCLDACHRSHTADVYLVSSDWGMMI